MDRPTFRLDGQPIRAVFFDLYSTDSQGEIYHLMQEKEGILEEFGGKTDAQDFHYLDTGVRETLEESNGVLNHDELLQEAQHAINEGRYILNASSKALIVRVFCPRYYHSSLFGDREIHDNHERKVVYVSATIYRDSKTRFHPRMTYAR